jgi:hypothetical protein
MGNSIGLFSTSFCKDDQSTRLERAGLGDRALHPILLVAGYFIAAQLAQVAARY